MEGFEEPGRCSRLDDVSSVIQAPLLKLHSAKLQHFGLQQALQDWRTPDLVFASRDRSHSNFLRAEVACLLDQKLTLGTTMKL